MKRRAILLSGGAWVLAAATLSLAQGLKTARRIAVLLPGTQSAYRHLFDAFRAEMKRLGHIEGRNISIETRYTDYKMDQLEPFAAELVALNPAVIVTATSAAVAASRKATSTIPIVFATAINPVEQGFATSLGRPGGNITGVILHSSVAAKVVEIAREVLPQARRLAFLVYSEDPVHQEQLKVFLPAAKKLKFDPVVIRVKRAEDLALAFDETLKRKPDALMLPDQSFIRAHIRYLYERSLSAKLPLFASNEEFSTAGCLVTYGSPREENYRRAARLVDKILGGTKPGELPMEQPERFHLVINMKTAKAIGVRLSPALMARADRVIE